MGTDRGARGGQGGGVYGCSILLFVQRNMAIRTIEVALMFTLLEILSWKVEELFFRA